MKRDLDLARRILLALEALPGPDDLLNPADVPGYDARAVSLHLALLDEAGLVVTLNAGGSTVFGKRLTWAGHEFLEQVREPGAWNRIRAAARDKGLDLSYETLKSVIRHLIEAAL